MKYILVVIFSVFNSFLSYSQEDFRSEIKFLRYEQNVGRVYFEVVGYGMAHLTGEKDAMENLFSSIFFRGIPGSTTLKPLIGINESEILKAHKFYFQSFYDNKRFISFVNEKECSSLSGRGKRRKLKCIISVDIQTLREDLKNNKIISDYGF